MPRAKKKIPPVQELIELSMLRLLELLRNSDLAYPVHLSAIAKVCSLIDVKKRTGNTAASAEEIHASIIEQLDGIEEINTNG